MPSPNNVNFYVQPTDYPATKDEIIRAAKQRGAPENVLADLERLPDRRYENFRDLLEGADDAPQGPR